MSDVAGDIERLCEIGLYDIVFRNAGVAFKFYEGPAEQPDDWRRYLRIKRYYPTFTEALEAEVALLDAAELSNL